MDVRAVIRDGRVVPFGPLPLADGTEVQIVAVPPADVPVVVGPQPTAEDGPFPTFAEEFGDLRVDNPDSPGDLAAQHDHYRLGTPKR